MYEDPEDMVGVMNNCFQSVFTGEATSNVKPQWNTNVIRMNNENNTQLQNQMEANKSKMLTKYLEKQRRVRDSIMQELQRGPSKVMQRNLEKELDSINRQIAKIQEELKTLHSQTRSSPRSPPLSRPSFSLPHSHHHHHHHHPTHSRSVSDIPPPLPARNRPLVSQTSAPNISTSSTSSSSMSLASAPPLPPRLTLERVGEGGLAQSLENIPKGQCLSHSGLY
ncbi:hypothetical protein E2C01_033390 [Portunus trituberculatus]|uniref:Uncharacterized protein n=1 Tax=Portunus trituberculatus TaxID=210409 RepID=A0A5B7EXR2_PORTR|nr:hypothetical protein [Portunus trituberculatus]